MHYSQRTIKELPTRDHDCVQRPLQAAASAITLLSFSVATAEVVPMDSYRCPDCHCTKEQQQGRALEVGGAAI